MTDDMKPRLVEPSGVRDTYVSGLGEVEDIGGGNFRFSFYAKQNVNGVEEWAVVANLVAHSSAVPAAVHKAATAIGCSMLCQARMSLN